MRGFEMRHVCVVAFFALAGLASGLWTQSAEAQNYQSQNGDWRQHDRDRDHGQGDDSIPNYVLIGGGMLLFTGLVTAAVIGSHNSQPNQPISSQ